MSKITALRYARVFYFLFYAAWSFLLPFLALHYQNLGFTGTQIGILASISPLTTLLAAPFWGGLADARQSHKRILTIGMVGAGISVFLLWQVRSFWLIVPVVASYAFFSSTIMPLIDNTVLSLLGDQRDQYGKQRLWGAIGWGLAGPVAGWLTGSFGLHWSFIGYLSLLFIGLLISRSLPVIGAHSPGHFWEGVRQLLRDQRWIIFLLIAFIGGAGLSVITNFLFLYMNELHASRTVMGLSLLAATISEIPVLFFSGMMLRRWGPKGLMVISLIVYVLRSYSYAVVTAPWQVLMIQLTHGLTFSTMWVAGVSLAGEIAPPGLGATAQGIFSSTVMGFGGITGALVGGLLLDYFGGKGMYFWSGNAVLLALVIFLLMSRRLSVPVPIKE